MIVFAKSSSMSWPRNMIRSRYIRLNTSIHCAWSIPGNLYGTWGTELGIIAGAPPGGRRRRPQRRRVRRDR